MMERRYIVDKEGTAKKLCKFLLTNIKTLNYTDDIYKQIETSSIHWDMDYIMSQAKLHDITPVFEKEQAIHQSMRQTVRVLIINFLTDHLGEQFTYMEIAHKLVASDNTVYQTMHRMINEGSPIVCVRVSGKSNLYSIPNDKPVFGEGA